MTERRNVHVVAAYIERNGQVLLDRRSPGKHLEGTWEFPGGKREPGETDIDALVRELREELGVDSFVGAEIGRVQHAYEEFDLTLVLYEVEVRGEPRAVEVAEVRWFPRRSLREVPMPPADKPLLEAIERAFEDTVC